MIPADFRAEHQPGAEGKIDGRLIGDAGGDLGVAACGDASDRVDRGKPVFDPDEIFVALEGGDEIAAVIAEILGSAVQGDLIPSVCRMRIAPRPVGVDGTGAIAVIIPESISRSSTSKHPSPCR